VKTIERLLEALAEAARNDRKSEFDQLERDLLTLFEGSFDAMPRDVYEQYLEVDRLWPLVVAPADGGDAAEPAAGRRHAVSVSLSTEDAVWLRQLGDEADRSLSAVLSACLERIRSDDALRDEIARQLRRPGEGD